VFYNNIWTVACAILTHLNAVWQFRQIQTPEDGHIEPKHVVLRKSEDGIDIHRKIFLSACTMSMYFFLCASASRLYSVTW
jgi:hypothetical protein